MATYRQALPAGRQAQILNAIIEEYIASANPVSSSAVFDMGIFDISCPTIRNEMAFLTEKGYLAQPHTSAGRVPTELGYRFFVDRILEKRAEERKQKAERFYNGEKSVQIKNLARKVTDLVVFINDEGEFRYAGLKNLLKNPEFESRDSVISLIGELEKLENSLDEVMDEVENEIQIFIGSENPFFAGGEYSMLATKFESSFIGIMGPMRMQYEKNLALLDQIL